MNRTINFLRYPGGKARLVSSFALHIPRRAEIAGRYVEPFVGGGAVFFFVNPERAILSDTNPELIDLYLGIKQDPNRVWQIYSQFPSSRAGYYEVRELRPAELDLAARAARTLYLNRTCFKGMWRHNASGEFNVGYGGQDRRWVVSRPSLTRVAARLQVAEVLIDDFENIIDNSDQTDFLFVDPPYKPGHRELTQAHYRFSRFTFAEQVRLADALRRATKRGVRWAMTNSSHPEILELYPETTFFHLPRGTGANIGQIVTSPGEILIRNYSEIF